MTAKKIVIVGLSASGKSTLANLLGRTWHLPVYHTDDYRFGPNWSHLTLPQFQQNVEDAIQSSGRLNEWIIEGSYCDIYDKEHVRPRQMERFLKDADLVLFLDPSKADIMASLMERSYYRSSGLLAGSQKETFASQSLLLDNMAQNYKTTRFGTELALLVAKQFRPEVVILQGPRTYIYHALLLDDVESLPLPVGMCV